MYIILMFTKTLSSLDARQEGRAVDYGLSWGGCCEHTEESFADHPAIKKAIALGDIYK